MGGGRSAFFSCFMDTVWSTNLCQLNTHIWISFWELPEEPAKRVDPNISPLLLGSSNKSHTLMIEQQHLLWTRKCITLNASFPFSMLRLTIILFKNKMNCILNFNRQASTNEPKMLQTQNVAVGGAVLMQHRENWGWVNSNLLEAFVGFSALLYAFSSLDWAFSQGWMEYKKWNKVLTKESVINSKSCISGKHLQKTHFEKINNFTLPLAIINCFCWENHLSQAQYYAQILLWQQMLKAPLKGASISIHSSAKH